MKKPSHSSPDEAAVATRQRHRAETRSQMLERLTNPLLSLHEAGVILNVCASTLRRYSDSGTLPHERTSGGQRRFRLRDVLALLDEREEQRQAARRRRRTRGRIRSSQIRPDARRTGVAATSHKIPVLSESERRTIEGQKVLAAMRARAQKVSQAAAQKNAVRATPPARTAPPARIPASRLAALGRAEMLEDEAQHKAQREED